MKNRILFIILISLILVPGCAPLYNYFGGRFAGPPSKMEANLSIKARALIYNAIKGFKPGEYTDYHIHVVGKGSGLGGFCQDSEHNHELYINPFRFSWAHPIWKIEAEVLMSACQIKNISEANAQYAERILDLVRHFPLKGKFHLMALDAYHELDGTICWKKTDLYVPSDYVVALADCLNQKIPDYDPFVPTISVHPYRSDAISELKRFAALGVKHVKWLPNVMNINPARKENTAFFKTMAELDMVLLAHTGHEHSIRVFSDNQKWGNPLLLTMALDHGVTVIMAHCGNDGESLDSNGKPRSNFDLFLEMMEKKKYQGQLFGEVSALTLKKQLYMWETLLSNKSLKGRLINGTDYPLPAVRVLMSANKMESMGLIPEDSKGALEEIYSYNPLIYDFVVKRLIRHPDHENLRLPTDVFKSIKHQAGQTDP